MYEVSLGAPSGDLLIGLKPEAAERVKAAILRALLAEAPQVHAPTTETAPLPAEGPEPRTPGGRRRKGLGERYGGEKANPRSALQVKIRRHVKTAVPGSEAEAMTLDTLLLHINENRAKPFSRASTAVAIGNLYREGWADRVRVGHQWAYWRIAAAPADADGRDRNGFKVTVAAGEGVVSGSLS